MSKNSQNKLGNTLLFQKTEKNNPNRLDSQTSKQDDSQPVEQKNISHDNDLPDRLDSQTLKQGNSKAAKQKSTSKTDPSNRLDSQTPEQADDQMPEQEPVMAGKIVKYKAMKKVTYYLPPEIVMEMKILSARTGHDLSDLAAEAAGLLFEKYKHK